MGLIASFFAARFAGPSFRGGSVSNPTWMGLDVGMGGVSTYAGTSVDEQTALSISAVYRSVVLIADAVSMLPVAVLRKDGEKRLPEPEHPVAKLLANPNALMNAVDFRASMQAHALQYGNGYMDVQRTQGGAPIALWPLLPDRTQLVGVESNGERRLVYTTSVEGKQLALEPADVGHIRGLSFDGLRGYSPLRLAQQGLGLALALEEFGSKFFGNDAKSGGFLSHPGKLSPEAYKRLQDSMAERGGLTNAHRIKILEENMTFNAVTIAPEDAQFLMTRTFQVEEIARLYGIPLHMLQSHAKSTSWGSGIAQMSLGFLVYTIAPWLVRWEQEYDRKLFTQQERDEGYYTKHNVTALLRSDPQTRAAFYKAALDPTTGWLERNEVRALEDMNPDEEDRIPAPRAFGGSSIPVQEEDTEETKEEGLDNRE